MLHRVMSKLKMRRRGSASFARNSDGAVAVEMALVSFPFLFMMFGIMNTGLYFYAINCVDRGLEDAARYVRTGEAQKGTAPGYSTQMTTGQFKLLVCQRATGYIDCSKLNLRIQSGSDWSTINPFSCPTAGVLSSGSINTSDTATISSMTGTQNSVVLITACYQWTMGQWLPFVKFGQTISGGSGGGTLIQSSTALKIEPYN